MKYINRLLTILFAMLISVASFAQESAQVEMADGLRSSGKIYVIVIIILIVLIGLLAYVFTIDRKVTKLEKKVGLQ